MGDRRHDVIRVRPILRSDADTFAALVRRVFLALPLNPPPSAGRLSGDDVRTHLDGGGGGLVAEADGMVAGLLWDEGNRSLHVGRIAVDPSCRRQGLATRLLAGAQAEAERRRLASIGLSTRLALTANRRLFAHFGFVETVLHAHPGYTQPTFVDMVKPIAGSAACDHEAIIGAGDEPTSPPGV